MCLAAYSIPSISVTEGTVCIAERRVLFSEDVDVEFGCESDIQH